jgi:large repetitive protein
VTIWVAPRLKVTGPADSGLHGTAGTPWSISGNLVTASEGTPGYQYSVTSGSLPAGLTLDPATGAISGTPAVAAKGSSLVTVTATDSAASPLTGSVTFTLTVD